MQAKLPGRLSRGWLLTLLALVAVSGSLFIEKPAAEAQVPPSGLSEDASPEFSTVAAAVQIAMAGAKVPGAAVGIYYQGRTEVATFGIADINTGEAVNAATRFEIGSVSKTYTAVAIMRLVEEGKLDLDAKVRHYLPDLELQDESVAAAIEVRHLLNHSGGWWGDALIDTGDGAGAIEAYVEDVLPLLPQVAPLGEYVTYNNSAYTVLGRIIEVVTGKTYREALDELVLEPLNLDETTLDQYEVLSGSYANSHGEGIAGTQTVMPLFLPRSAEPAGGLWSTVEEQLAYGRFHLGHVPFGEEPLLEPETIALMREPTLSLPDQPDAFVAMPWLIGDVAGFRVVEHSGDTYGQSSRLTLIPQADFALSVLTNAQTGGLVTQAALLAALSVYFGVDVGDGESELPEPIALTPQQMAAYIGEYEIPIARLIIFEMEGGLWLVSEMRAFPGFIIPSNTPLLPPEQPPIPLVFLTEDIAVMGSLEAPLGAFMFVRQPDGSVGWITTSLRLYPKTD